MRVAQLMRRAVGLTNEMIRGPKKKKGGGDQGKVQSTDIVNIFKDRSDPVIGDIQTYPIYVQQLSLGLNTFHEHLLGLAHDIDTLKPYRSNYNGFIKAFKRQRTKALNLYRHLDGKPDIQSEDDITNRRMLYIIGSLSKEEQQKKRKEQEAAYAAQDDDDQ